jgi:hypothetical protein
MRKPSVNQCKNRSIKIGILIAVFVVVLLLVISSHIQYSGFNTIYQETNASRALTFELKAGQTIRGHVSFGDHRFNYSVNNDQFDEIFSTETTTRNGYFIFTSNVDGHYYLNISTTGSFYRAVDSFYYYYTISPAFLGVNVMVWIDIIITITVALELIVFIKKRTVKQ